MTQEELINIIATYLPVDEERATNIINGINNGYALGDVDYIEALSSRDKTIEKLSNIIETQNKIINELKNIINPNHNEDTRIYKATGKTPLELNREYWEKENRG
jgi:prefoldin subunit 5